MATVEKPERMSAARLNLLRECPRCFWLVIKRGIKRPSMGFPTLPARFDRIIQEYCQPYRDTDQLPPLLKETGLEGRLIKAKLKPWIDPESGLALTGRLDECLETPSEGFAPLDHKTRGYTPSSPNINPNYILQLDVYSALLQGNGYRPADFAVLVYYIPDWGGMEEGVRFNIEVTRVDTSVARALQMLGKARATLDMDTPPQPSHRCEFCKWAFLQSDL